MLRLNRTGSKNQYVRNISESRHILHNINWDFSSKSIVSEGVTPFDCRRHHWFPATFVPEIPFTLIEILTYPYAKVYDPFSGIGTTYFQALLLNRRPLAADICTVAVEFMKSLRILFDPQSDFESIRDLAKKIVTEFDPSTDYIKRLEEDSSVNILVDELRPWYHRSTFNRLAYLFLKEHYCDDEPTRAAMRICISAILKRASSQGRGWGCIADNMKPKESQIMHGDKNVLVFFYRHLKRLLGDLSAHLANVTKEYNDLYDETGQKETIFQADTRESNLIPDDSVDLVVTSPSYPNMTDYVKSQRLSYYWLGIPVSGRNSDLIAEIGARNKRHRKNTLKNYVKDLEDANEMLAKKVRYGGYVCFVMPLFGQNDSQRRRAMDRVLLNLGEHFVKEDEFIRAISPVRRAHNLKWATLEQEKIFVFRK